jgi:hypothetical protein
MRAAGGHEDKSYRDQLNQRCRRHQRTPAKLRLKAWLGINATLVEHFANDAPTLPGLERIGFAETSCDNQCFP